jgi:hypothetical protein
LGFPITDLLGLVGFSSHPDVGCADSLESELLVKAVTSGRLIACRLAKKRSDGVIGKAAQDGLTQ